MFTTKCQQAKVDNDYMLAHKKLVTSEEAVYKQGNTQSNDYLFQVQPYIINRKKLYKKQSRRLGLVITEWSYV